MPVIIPLHFGLSATQTVSLTHRFIVIFLEHRPSAAVANIRLCLSPTRSLLHIFFSRSAVLYDELLSASVTEP